MNKRIQTYEDLLREKQQLEVLLKAQKELIRYDWQDIKVGLKPVTNLLSLVGTREKGMFLTAGSNKLIDLVLKKVLLARSGWLTRLVIPFLVKNISSHVVVDREKSWMKKLFAWIGPKNRNGQAAPEPSNKPNKPEA